MLSPFCLTPFLVSRVVASSCFALAPRTLCSAPSSARHGPAEHSAPRLIPTSQTLHHRPRHFSHSAATTSIPSKASRRRSANYSWPSSRHETKFRFRRWDRRNEVLTKTVFEMPTLGTVLFLRPSAPSPFLLVARPFSIMTERGEHAVDICRVCISLRAEHVATSRAQFQTRDIDDAA